MSRRILGSMFSGERDEENVAPSNHHSHHHISHNVMSAQPIDIPRIASLQNIAIKSGSSPTGTGNGSMRFTSTHVRGSSFDMGAAPPSSSQSSSMSSSSMSYMRYAVDARSRSPSPPVRDRPRSPFDVLEQHSSSMSSSGAAAAAAATADSGDSYEPVVDEVPLLEELGINFREIWVKSLFVLNPFRRRLNKGISSQSYQQQQQQQQRGSTTHDLLDDKDLAGPLIFCLALGTVLLLSGKVHFGYIYGVGTLGCLSIYLLLNLIHQRSVEMQRTASILGYGLLPMVILAIAKTVVPLVVHSRTWSVVALVLGFVVVVWSTMSATSMFVTTLRMHHHKWILAYPILLVYITFALITVF